MLSVKRKRVYGSKAKQAAKRKFKTKALVAGSRSAFQGSISASPLQRALRSNMRLLDSGGLLGAAGAISAVTYQINSLFDPTGAIGTNQPRGFDQLMVLYQRYRVTNCLVTVKFGGNASVTSACVIGIQITDSATAPTSFREGIENGNCTWDLMSFDSSQTKTLSMKCDISKFVGRPTSDDALMGDATANPAKLLYAHVFIQSVNQTSQSPTVGLVVTLDFDCLFLEPINVAAS